MQSSHPLLHPKTGKSLQPEGKPVCDRAGRLPPLTSEAFLQFPPEENNRTASPPVQSWTRELSQPVRDVLAFIHSVFLELCSVPETGDAATNRTALLLREGGGRHCEAA